MPKFVVTYSKTFSHTIEADSLEHAGTKSVNFAKSYGQGVKILNVFVEGYVGPIEDIQPAPLTHYEKMVAGMRKKIDSMLKP
jgi:hypothetical protein